jgi:DNA-binding NtrC family response regulator
VPRLIIKAPDGQLAHTVDLDATSCVLIGRSPDPQQLPAGGQARPAPRMVNVDAASVSANHLLAWAERDQVCVQDLGSRNGSWLKLPATHPTCNLGQEAVVQLARSSQELPTADEPSTPVWRTEQDFGAALKASLVEWLERQRIGAKVSLVGGNAEIAPPNRVPLASGDALDIVPLATTDASWERALEQLWRWTTRQNSVYEAERQTREEGMILSSPAIRAAHRDVVDAAQSDARTLLLTGPSGAGKEMLAEVFHRYSGRSGAFVAVNCSMFSKELLRSELFGAEAGSFTGASRRIVGAVERAQGGTLFLDEIAELPPEVQPMLLRFLDRREFEQLGQYGKPCKADVRVVAATNRDLRELTRAGAFRADLWFRLSVHVVEVPPLRARWQDIETYLRGLHSAGGRCSLYQALSGDALELLRGHAWDGNFRELTNLAERLPRDAAAGTISVGVCQKALELGSLRPRTESLPVERPSGAHADWAELTTKAIRCFVDDHGREPTSWDDQKEWNEKYLKPLVFFQLSGAATQPAPVDEDGLAALASRSAARARADRGTALKQLGRYFERYRS